MRLDTDSEAIGIKAHRHIKLAVSRNQHPCCGGGGERHHPCVVVNTDARRLQHAVLVDFDGARDGLFQRAGFVFTAAGVGFCELKGRLRTVSRANQLPCNAVIAPILEAKTIRFLMPVETSYRARALSQL